MYLKYSVALYTFYPQVKQWLNKCVFNSFLKTLRSSAGPVVCKLPLDNCMFCLNKNFAVAD